VDPDDPYADLRWWVTLAVAITMGLVTVALVVATIMQGSAVQ